jgi:hypothetical protein
MKTLLKWIVLDNYSQCNFKFMINYHSLDSHFNINLIVYLFLWVFLTKILKKELSYKSQDYMFDESLAKFNQNQDIEDVII